MHFSDDNKFFTDETINKKLKQSNQKIAARGLYFSNLKLEREANNFAANLLMPDFLINRYIYENGIICIKDLADIFEVSSEAMKNRLKNLGIIPNF